MPSLPSPLLHCKWILALLLLLVVAGVGAQSAGSIEGSTISLQPTKVMPLTPMDTSEFLPLSLRTSQRSGAASSVTLLPFADTVTMESTLFMEVSELSLSTIMEPERMPFFMEQSQFAVLEPEQTSSLILMPTPEQTSSMVLMPDQSLAFILEPEQTSSMVLMPDQSLVFLEPEQTSSVVLMPDQSSAFILEPEQSSLFLAPEQTSASESSASIESPMPRSALPSGVLSSGVFPSSALPIMSSVRASQTQVEATASDIFFQLDSTSSELFFLETVTAEPEVTSPGMLTTASTLLPPKPSPVITSPVLSPVPMDILFTTAELVLLPDSTIDFIPFPSATPTAAASFPPSLSPTPSPSNDFLRPFLSSEINRLPLTTLFPSTPSLSPTLLPSPSSPFTTDIPIQPSTTIPELDLTLDFSPTFSADTSVLARSEAASFLLPDMTTPTLIPKQLTPSISPPTVPSSDAVTPIPTSVTQDPLPSSSSQTQPLLLETATATPSDTEGFFFIVSTSQIQPSVTSTPSMTGDFFSTSQSESLLVATPTPTPVATEDFLFPSSSVETLLLQPATSFTSVPATLPPSSPLAMPIPSSPPVAPLPASTQVAPSSPEATPLSSALVILLPIMTSDVLDILAPTLTSALLEPSSPPDNIAPSTVATSMTSSDPLTPSAVITPPVVSLSQSSSSATTTPPPLLMPDESTETLLLPTSLPDTSVALTMPLLSPTQQTIDSSLMRSPSATPTSTPEETPMQTLFIDSTTLPISVGITMAASPSLSVNFDLSSAVGPTSVTLQPDFFLTLSVSATPMLLTTMPPLSATPLPLTTPAQLTTLLLSIPIPTQSSSLPPSSFSLSQVASADISPTQTSSLDLVLVSISTSVEGLLPESTSLTPASTSVDGLVPASTSVDGLVPASTSVDGLVPASTSVDGLVPASTSVDGLVPASTSLDGLVPASTSVDGLVPASTSLDRLVPASTSVDGLVPASTSVDGLVPASTSVEGFVPTPSIPALSSFFPASTSTEGLVPTSTSTEGLVPASTSIDGLVPASTSAEGLAPVSTRMTSSAFVSTPTPMPILGTSIVSSVDVVASSPVAVPLPTTPPGLSETLLPSLTASSVAVSDVLGPSTVAISLSISDIVSPSPSPVASDITTPSEATSSVQSPSIPASSSIFFSSPQIDTTSDILVTPTVTTPLSSTFASSSDSATATVTLTPTTATFDLQSSQSPLATPLATPTTPSSPTCPSLSTPNTVINDSHRVTIGLALTSSEHVILEIPNSQKRCDLEAALVDIFMQGQAVQARVGKRQAVFSSYDADISAVGALSEGSSSITFHILNGTDMTSDPVPVPAPLVAMAIAAASVQEVDSYPIIMAAAPIMTTAVTMAVPVGTDSLLIPLVAGVGGAIILLLFVIIFILICCWAICYRKKGVYDVQAVQSLEGGRTYAESRDFTSYRHNSVAIQHGTPVLTRASTSKGEGPGMTISQLAWTDGADRPPSKEIQVPPGLFERVIHYDDTPPPPTGSSPSIQGLRMRLRTSSIVPSLSASNKSSESVPTPAALRPPSRPSIREVEAKRLREEALNLQEQQEEKELKLRRKATLERLLLQSRERDPFSRSRASQRSRRKKRGTVTPLDQDMPRPSSHSKPDWSLGQPEVDAELGDAETSPQATPTADLPAATSSPRPSTKRRHTRKKSNRIGPAHTTDGYDSTDHRTKPPLSRHRGRSQRGRPFTQQSMVVGGGRDSRGVAYDAHQELAWLDTGAGGVQLMRFNPIATPPYALPPHPSTPQHVVQVQPHPQPLAQSLPRPQEAQSLAQPSLVQEKLPALNSLQSQSYSQKQLETYFRIHQEMERLHLHHSTQAPPRTKATPTQALKTTPTPDGDKGGARPGERAATPTQEAMDGNPVTPNPAHTPADPAHIPAAEEPLDNSYSSTIHDFMTQMLNSSGGAGRGLDSRLLDSRLMNRESSMDLPQQQFFTPAPPGAWEPVAGRVATPYQLYAPPPASHYGTSSLQPPYTPTTPRQLLWAPTEPHPMAPPTDHTHMAAQMLSPARLSQLRRNQDYSNRGHPDQNWPERYSPPYHLPSHTQVRKHRDPFQ